MAAVSPIQTCFNAGELSPLIAGRVDYQKYVNGCKTMANFLPTVQGPAINRPGFHYVASTQNPADRSILIPFVFSETTAFVLEFGAGYIAFYADHGQVIVGGSPYTIASPYAVNDLTNPDGTNALSFAQSGDVIYIASGNHPPQKLTRLSNTSWTIAPVNFTNGPFAPINLFNPVSVTASAQTGAITLTASAGIFTPADVGTQFYFQYPPNPAAVWEQWQAGIAVSAGFTVQSGTNFYIAQNSGTTGSIEPIHTQGTKSDGVVNWTYLSSGYGNVTITGYTSSTVVNATVNPGNYLVPSISSSTASTTTLWAKAQWSATNGYPTVVTFFRDRLTWAQGTQLFFSVAADFENMATEDFGVVSDDMAVIINIASDRYDQINWLASVDVLLVGTIGSEYAVSESNSNSGFGPLNVQAKQQTGNGGRSVAPVIFNSSVLFVQRAGRKLREMRYSFATNNYQSIDLTVLSEHITHGQIVDMDFQQEPNYIVWCALANGNLVAMTYCREQDTIGWHEHPLGGGAVVEAVACIPTPDGTADELWAILNITINGTLARYVCYLDQGWDATTDLSTAFYLDMGATSVNGSPVSTISGLGYLQGQTVSILADGAPQPNQVVPPSGSITLQFPASTIQVGLPYTSTLTSMRFVGGGQTGNGQGMLKRISHCIFRFLNTLGGQYGNDGGPYDTIQWRSSFDLMNEPPPPFTGDVKVEWNNGTDFDGYVSLQQTQPLPMTVVAMMPQFFTNDPQT